MVAPATKNQINHSFLKLLRGQVEADLVRKMASRSLGPSSINEISSYVPETFKNSFLTALEKEPIEIPSKNNNLAKPKELHKLFNQDPGGNLAELGDESDFDDEEEGGQYSYDNKSAYDDYRRSASEDSAEYLENVGQDIEEEKAIQKEEIEKEKQERRKQSRADDQAGEDKANKNLSKKENSPQDKAGASSGDSSSNKSGARNIDNAFSEPNNTKPGYSQAASNSGSGEDNNSSDATNLAWRFKKLEKMKNDQEDLPDGEEIDWDSGEYVVVTAEMIGRGITAKWLNAAWLAIPETFGISFLWVMAHGILRYIFQIRYFCRYGQEWSFGSDTATKTAESSKAMSKIGQAAKKAGKNTIIGMAQNTLEIPELIAVGVIAFILYFIFLVLIALVLLVLGVI